MNTDAEEQLTKQEDARLERWLAATPLLPSSPSFCDAVMKEIEQSQPWWQGVKQSIWRPRTLQWNIPAAAVSFTFLVAMGIGLYQSPSAPSNQPELAQNTTDAQAMAVHFELQAPDAGHVAVVGDFSQWQKQIPMVKQSNGTWVVDIPLTQGSYEYAFVVDKNRWVQDPKARVHRDDGFGNRNAVLAVNSI